MQLVSKELAENYIIDSNNVVKMCRYNREVAENFARPDLVQCWTLAEMIALALTETETDDGCGLNPFTKNLLDSL